MPVRSAFPRDIPDHAAEELNKIEKWDMLSVGCAAHGALRRIQQTDGRAAIHIGQGTSRMSP
jgi:hypothetical protein